MSLREDLEAFGLSLPESFPLDKWAAQLRDNPCRNTLAVAAASSLVFFAAERGRNPKVNDIYDALVYCTTCLSVGYADIFAKTPIGKVLGSVLMTLGPALSNSALDGPGAHRHDQTQEEMLATLKQILAKLQAPTDPAGPPSPAP